MATPGRFGFLRTTFVGGVLFLIPLVALIAILEKALALLDKVAAPLARELALRDIGGLLPARRLLAIAILVVLCFLAGLLARTRLARRLVEHAETRVLSNIPGYSFLKSLVESLLGTHGQDELAVVLVRIEDAWQYAFVMERLDNAEVVVFVPGAPDASSGSVFVMEPDRIRPVEAKMSQAVKCLHRLGRGSAKLIRS